MCEHTKAMGYLNLTGMKLKEAGENSTLRILIIFTAHQIFV